MTTHVRALVALLRHLLHCSQVCCLLYCPDETARHPLLQFLCVHAGQVCEPPEFVSLLEHEQVRTLLDLAVQSQGIWCLNHTSFSVERSVMQSIVVAPLKRPAGLLGFVFCLDTDPAAFLEGECQLLERFLPYVARQIERFLCDAYAPFSPLNTAEAAHVSDADSEGLHEHLLFISLVCHELRAPLAAIKGYAGLLQAFGRGEDRECITPALQQRYVDTILEQTGQLEVLLGDLLDLSCIQVGRLQLRPVPTNLAPLCHTAAQQLQLRLKQQEVQRYHIRCQIEHGLPPALADPVRTRQVLANLLENAVKYSPEGGPITIEVGRSASSKNNERAQTLSITVRDRGIGIPDQQQSQLFRRFQRLERPAIAGMPGYGLGLYISHQLVVAMGGRMTVISSEHEGTSVTFTLPIFFDDPT